VSALTSVNAVRALQEWEGYTPCFGRPVPLKACGDDNRKCALFECFWKETCDSYRTSAVLPLDAVLQDRSHNELESLRGKLLEFNSAKASLSSGAVGLSISSLQHLSSATRKMLLSTPRTVVGEAGSGGQSALKPYVLTHKTQMSHMYKDYNIYHYFDLIWTRDLTELSRWLEDAHQFMTSGNLAYYPLIVSDRHQTRSGLSPDPSYKPITYSVWVLPEELPVKSFDAPHYGVPDGEIMLTSADCAPLLNIDLPVLEGVSFDLLFRLMTDFPDELGSLRDFLHSEIDQMRSLAVGSPTFGQDCDRIARHIREQIRRVDSKYKSNRLKAAFALTGGAVATFTLALYCIVQRTPNALTFLGPGGIAYTISAAYADYLVKRLELKNDPVYFLWLLGQSRRRV
jgi:hypothetical protein